MEAYFELVYMDNYVWAAAIWKQTHCSVQLKVRSVSTQ